MALVHIENHNRNRLPTPSGLASPPRLDQAVSGGAGHAGWLVSNWWACARKHAGPTLRDVLACASGWYASRMLLAPAKPLRPVKTVQFHAGVVDFDCKAWSLRGLC